MRFSLTLLFCLGIGSLSAQWDYGIQAEVGAARGFNVDRLSLADPVGERVDIEGGIAAAIGVRVHRRLLPNLTLGFAPMVLFQDYAATFPPRDGRQFFAREQLYSTVLLLPVNLERTFGSQLVRPVLGAGAGAMVDLGRRGGRTDLMTEAIVPYLEVNVGFELPWGRGGLRPGLVVRHGLGSVVGASGGRANSALSGERWAYVGFQLLALRPRR